MNAPPRLEVVELWFMPPPGEAADDLVCSLPLAEPEGLRSGSWWRSVCFGPEHSPVAYVRRKGRVAVWAWLRLWGRKLQVVATSDFLGRSDTVSINLARGDVLGPFRFEFDAAEIGGDRVETKDISIVWSVASTGAGGSRTGGEPTRHRVYLLPRQPLAPWDHEPPITTLLELACRWAHHQRDDGPIAEAVTRGFHEIGPAITCYRPSATRFVGTTTPQELPLDAAALALALRSGSAPPSVSCLDVSASVAALCRLLGVDMQVIGVSDGQAQLETNRVRALGADRALYVTPSGVLSFHRTAARREKGVWKVYDACFQVDGFEHPSRLPFVGELPLGQSTTTYLGKLSTHPGGVGPHPPSPSMHLTLSHAARTLHANVLSSLASDWWARARDRAELVQGLVPTGWEVEVEVARDALVVRATSRYAAPRNTAQVTVRLEPASADLDAVGFSTRLGVDLERTPYARSNRVIDVLRQAEPPVWVVSLGDLTVLVFATWRERGGAQGDATGLAQSLVDALLDADA